MGYELCEVSENIRLPQYVRKHYQLKMGDRRLMDIKSDIFTNLKQFIAEMEAEEQLSALRLNTMTSSTEPSLAAFTQRGGRGRSRARSRGTTRPQPQRQFCRSC